MRRNIDMAENQDQEQKDYAEPSMLDTEDLENVSGGGCGTGGTIIVQKQADGTTE
jgi:hypothetical protein